MQIAAKKKAWYVPGAGYEKKQTKRKPDKPIHAHLKARIVKEARPLYIPPLETNSKLTEVQNFFRRALPRQT